MSHSGTFVRKFRPMFGFLTLASLFLWEVERNLSQKSILHAQLLFLPDSCKTEFLEQASDFTTESIGYTPNVSTMCPLSWVSWIVPSPSDFQPDGQHWLLSIWEFRGHTCSRFIVGHTNQLIDFVLLRPSFVSCRRPRRDPLRCVSEIASFSP